MCFVSLKFEETSFLYTACASSVVPNKRIDEIQNATESCKNYLEVILPVYMQPVAEHVPHD